jgi:hypothetical protein
MTRKTLSMIVLGVALATAAASAVRACPPQIPECTLTVNGSAANTLTTGQTGQIVAVELR